jgi:hypothetical protein
MKCLIPPKEKKMKWYQYLFVLVIAGAAYFAGGYFKHCDKCKAIPVQKEMVKIETGICPEKVCEACPKPIVCPEQKACPAPVVCAKQPSPDQICTVDWKAGKVIIKVPDSENPDVFLNKHLKGTVWKKKD